MYLLVETSYFFEKNNEFNSDNKEFWLHGIFDDFKKAEIICKEWNTNRRERLMCILPFILNEKMKDENIEPPFCYYAGLEEKDEPNIKDLIKEYKNVI